jgi:anaerobic selenocysteine-containing dehydrogenase
VPTTLKRFDDPERPPVNKYLRTFENQENEPEIAARYPLRLLTPHSRYPFHLMGDDEGCFLRDIREHRVKVGDHYYLTCRLSPEDAAARDIKDDDLIRLWNDRGSVVCAAQVTDRLRPGVISAPTASAEYRPAGEPGKSTDLGGCVNVLNTSKPITTKSHGIRPNGTLIEVEKWTGVDTWKPAAPNAEAVA